MRMVRSRQSERLDSWLCNVRASRVPELQSLVKSIEQDKAAVLAGLSLAHNNGVVEGKVYSVPQCCVTRNCPKR